MLDVGCWVFSVGSLVGGKMYMITIGFVPDFLGVKIDAKKRFVKYIEGFCVLC